MSVPKSKRNIYIACEAKSLKNKRNYLWNKFTKIHSQSDYVAYTQARNTLHSFTHDLCRSFEQQVTNNIQTNPKAFWSYARSRMKTCVTIGSDGQLHHSDYHRANAFNKFFSMDKNPDTISIFTTGRGDLSSLSSINVTPDLVFDKLNSLKPGKSPGPDGWPPTVLKTLATQLCVPFAILFTKKWFVTSGLEDRIHCANF